MRAGHRETAVWGVDPAGVRFEAPNGVGIDANGRVYVTEFQAGRVRRFEASGLVEVEAGGSGTDPGQLSHPIGVAVAPDGRMFVSESGTSRVSVFRADGTFVRVWGESGSAPGAFRSAMGIAHADGEVFVADYGNHRVQVFDETGTFVREWGESGATRGAFDNPIGVQIGPAGHVWVVDSGNARVQVFTRSGALVRVFDAVGPRPEIVSVNAEGAFYVSTPWSDSRVRHFSPEGVLLGFVGEGLKGPHGTATAPDGTLYVAETAAGRVRVFGRIESGTLIPKKYWN